MNIKELSRKLLKCNISRAIFCIGVTHLSCIMASFDARRNDEYNLLLFPSISSHSLYMNASIDH